MKKSLTLFCGLLISVAAFAQTSATVSLPHLNRNAVKTIIKNYSSNYPATISCSNSNDSVTFIYTDATMQATEAIILKNYYINDMVINGDSVFFCGRTEAGLGLIGYFDINDVFFGTGNIQIRTTFFAGEEAYPVKELTRLVTYFWGEGYRHVVCIGTCGDESYPCVVDLTLDHFPYYNAGCVKTEFETFTDIEIVQNSNYDYYIATVGFDTENGRYINIRMYDMNDVFMPNGLQDMCHVYCMDTSYVRPWLEGDVLLASINAGKMATVSYRSPNNLIPVVSDEVWLSNTIHLAFFDVYLLLNNSVYALIDNYEINSSITTKMLMNQFICSRLKNSIAFLHTYEMPSLGSEVSEYFDIDLGTLSSSGQFQAYRNYGTLQQGLSLYDADSKYILSGHEQALPTTLKLQMNSFGVQSGCAEPLKHKYNRVKRIDSRNFKRAFSVIGALSNPDSHEEIIEETPIYIKCLDDND